MDFFLLWLIYRIFCMFVGVCVGGGGGGGEGAGVGGAGGEGGGCWGAGGGGGRENIYINDAGAQPM